jgi:hypothetical protein
MDHLYWLEEVPIEVPMDHLYWLKILVIDTGTEHAKINRNKG